MVHRSDIDCCEFLEIWNVGWVSSIRSSGMKFVESGNLERARARSLRFGGSPLGVVVNPLSRRPILLPRGRVTNEWIYPKCQMQSGGVLRREVIKPEEHGPTVVLRRTDRETSGALRRRYGNPCQPRVHQPIVAGTARVVVVDKYPNFKQLLQPRSSRRDPDPRLMRWTSGRIWRRVLQRI